MENETLDNISNQPNGGAINLPNATTVLVLGILSIVTCFFYGIPGLVLGIIGLSLAQKDMQLLKNSPGIYTNASVGNLRAGRTCAIIGLSLSAMLVLFVIVWFIIMGSLLTRGMLSH